MTAFIRRWIRRAIVHQYFPEIWYAAENWLSGDTNGKHLEVGCGRGLFTKAMVQDQWNITALEPSPSSIKRAEDRVSRIKKNSSSQHQIKFYKSSAEKMPFKDHSFQTMSCINFLESCDNPTKVLKEAYRTLKPGGKGIVVVFKKFSLWSLPLISKTLRKDPESQVYRSFTQKQLLQHIITSGFSIDTLRPKARYLPLQPKSRPFPWIFSGAIVALVKRPALGENQVTKPSEARGKFHKT